MNRQRVDLLEMIWPETGLQVTTTAPNKARDALTEDDQIELSLDFVTLSLTPTEFIQLAASLRLSVDSLLDHHPSLQPAVVAAFDVKM